MKAEDFNLGIGFNSAKEKPTYFQCVNVSSFDVSYYSRSSFSFQYNDIDEFEEKLHLWGIEGAGAILPGLMVGASGRGKDFFQESGYKKSFFYSYLIDLGVITLKSKKYGIESLSDFGKKTFLEQRDKFNEICGDKYISQQVLGSRLYIMLTFSAKTSQDKRELDLSVFAKLDLAVVIIKLSLFAKSYTEEIYTNYDVTIQVKQVGGYVVELASFLKEKNGEYTISCDSKNLDTCVTALKRLIQYSKTDFVNQIDILNLTQASVVKSIYMDYDKIGLSVNHDQQKIIKLKDQLGAIYYQISSDVEFIEHILERNNNVLSSYLKKFDVDVIQYIDLEEVIGIKRETSNNYWQWSVSKLPLRDRMSLEQIYKIIKTWQEEIERSYDKCALDIDLCSKGIDSIINSNVWEDYSTAIYPFYKAYKVAAICDNFLYPKYLLPISRTSNNGIIYYENSTYSNLERNNTVNIVNYYKIEDDQLYMLDSFLQTKFHCLTFVENTEAIEREFYGNVHTKECIDLMCPLEDTTNLYLMFSLVDNPI